MEAGLGYPEPLKVKYFMWLVLREMIVVRDKLCRFGMVQEVENVCAICVNNIRYLFVCFNQVYAFWFRMASLWGMYFVGVRDISMSGRNL